MKRRETGVNLGVDRISHVARALAIIVTAGLLSFCSGMSMNVSLDLRNSTLVLDSNSAYPGFDVVWLKYPGHGTSSSCGSAYGAPVIPELGIEVVLPQYMRVESVISIATGAESVPGTFRLMPQQRPSLCRTMPPEFVPPLPEIYDSVKPCPPKLLGYVCQGAPFGYNVATVVVCPVQYIPREGKLTFYRQFKFELLLAPDSSSYVPGRVQPGEVVRRDIEESIRGSVHNPEDVSRFAPWGE